MNAHEITIELGGKWQGSYGLCCCPAHDDGKPSLKLRDDPRKIDGIDVHCFGPCTWQEVKAELVRLGMLDAISAGAGSFEIGKPAELDASHADAMRRVRNIWRTAVPLTGTFGQKYFNEVRGLQIERLGDISHAVRCHQDLRTVISLMTDPVSCEVTGVQRTFLNDDATKRERMMLGHWGIVRVSPDEDVNEGLGLCEGVEDALAILLEGWAPVWAAASAGAIERFPVLSGIEALTIFRDEGEAGEKAAEACAQRWHEAGREVFIASLKDRVT